MSAKAARVDDGHLCPQHIGEKILPACAPTILIGGKPAARVTDQLACQGSPPDVIRMGEPTVLLEGKVAARFGDPTEHAGFVKEGEPTVLIGTLSAEAKRLRLMERLAKIDAARRQAATMPPGAERDRLDAAADRLARNNQAVEHARLAADSYNSDPSSAPEGWTRIDQWDSSSGMFAAAYRSQIDGRVVLAFRGSEMTLNDWLDTNFAQGFGRPSMQHAEAVAISRMMAAEHGENLSITGHSLGGGLASAGALATGRPADTFNAAGVHPLSYLYYGLDSAHEGNIQAYHVPGEILTSAQDNVFGMPDTVGNKHALTAVDAVTNADGSTSYQERPVLADPFRAPSLEGVVGLARPATWQESLRSAGNPLILLGQRLGDALFDRGEDAAALLYEAYQRHLMYIDPMEAQKTADLQTIEGMI